jgi:hypothetical protein
LSLVVARCALCLRFDRALSRAWQPVGAVETEGVALEVEAVEVEAVAGTQVKGDSEETVLMALRGGPLSSSLRSSSGRPVLSWREWTTAAAISNV